LFIYLVLSIGFLNVFKNEECLLCPSTHFSKSLPYHWIAVTGSDCHNMPLRFLLIAAAVFRSICVRGDFIFDQCVIGHQPIIALPTYRVVRSNVIVLV
jgi:hypothetical protein